MLCLFTHSVSSPQIGHLTFFRTVAILAAPSTMKPMRLMLTGTAGVKLQNYVQLFWIRTVFHSTHKSPT
jgi:hypothetical protein